MVGSFIIAGSLDIPRVQAAIVTKEITLEYAIEALAWLLSGPPILDAEVVDGAELDELRSNSERTESLEERIEELENDKSELESNVERLEGEVEKLQDKIDRLQDALA